MWSVVERTALAEAEVEYQDYESDTIWVKFPVSRQSPAARWLADASRSSSGRPRPGPSPATAPSAIRRGSPTASTRSTAAENDFGPQPGEKLIFADELAADAAAKAKVTLKRLARRRGDELAALTPCPSARRARRRLWLRGADADRRPRHRRCRHRLRPHRARPRPRGLRRLDGCSQPSLAARGIDTASRSPSTMPASSPPMRRASAGPARGCGARHRRQRQEGRRQQGRHRRR